MFFFYVCEEDRFIFGEFFDEVGKVFEFVKVNDWRSYFKGGGNFGKFSFFFEVVFW